jgi:hypothetical protein
MEVAVVRVWIEVRDARCVFDGWKDAPPLLGAGLFPRRGENFDGRGRILRDGSRASAEKRGLLAFRVRVGELARTSETSLRGEEGESAFYLVAPLPSPISGGRPSWPVVDPLLIVLFRCEWCSFLGLGRRTWSWMSTPMGVRSTAEAILRVRSSRCSQRTATTDRAESLGVVGLNGGSASCNIKSFA